MNLLIYMRMILKNKTGDYTLIDLNEVKQIKTYNSIFNKLK